MNQLPSGIKPGSVRWTGDDGRYVVAAPGDDLYARVSIIAQHVWVQRRGWVAVTPGSASWPVSAQGV